MHAYVTTSHKDYQYLCKISRISIKLFAEHIVVKMIPKHWKKYTAAEISKLVKVTKWEIMTLPKTSSEMSVLLIESVD